MRTRLFKVIHRLLLLSLIAYPGFAFSYEGGHQSYSAPSYSPSPPPPPSAPSLPSPSPPAGSMPMLTPAVEQHTPPASIPSSQLAPGITPPAIPAQSATPAMPAVPPSHAFGHEGLQVHEGIQRHRGELHRIEELKDRGDSAKLGALQQDLTAKIQEAEKRIQAGDVSGAQEFLRQADATRPLEKIHEFVPPREELKDFREKFKETEKFLPTTFEFKAHHELSEKFAAKAEEFLKRGKEREAQKFLEKAHQFSVHDETLFERGELAKLAPTAVEKNLAELGTKLDRTALGIQKVEALGFTFSSAEKAAFAHARVEFGQMQQAHKAGRTEELKSGIATIRELKLTEKFANFQGAPPPPEVLTRAAFDATKAKEYAQRAIAEAQAFGASFEELARLKADVEKVATLIGEHKDDAVLAGELTRLAEARQQEIAVKMGEVAHKAGREHFKSELNEGLGHIEQGIGQFADLTVAARHSARHGELVTQMRATLVRTKDAATAGDEARLEKLMSEGHALGARMIDFMKEVNLENPEIKAALADTTVTGVEARLGGDATKVAQVSELLASLPEEKLIEAKKLMTSADPQELEVMLAVFTANPTQLKKHMERCLYVPEKYREQCLDKWLDLQDELGDLDESARSAKARGAISKDAQKLLDEAKKIAAQILFPPESLINAIKTLEEKLATVTDPEELVVYIATLRDEFKKVTLIPPDHKIQRCKDGIRPLAAMDESHPLFDEAHYLRGEGVFDFNKLKDCGIGVKLDERLRRNEFEAMLNRTIDRKVFPEQSRGIVRRADAVRAVMSAYKIATDFNSRNLKQLTEFVNKVELFETPLTVRDLTRPLERDDAIALVAHADQRWGDTKK